MTVGLQIWNASGSLILSATSRVARYLGAATLSGTTGSLTDGNIGSGTVWYAFQRAQTFKLSAGNNPTGTLGYMIPPAITVSGDTITWTYPGKELADDQYATGQLFYGVY